jgi:quercetin dioxygenase-like cupin family protein
VLVIRADECELIETPGGNAGSAIATPSRGAAEVSVIRQRQMPGGANPAHTHDREEVMVLTAGTVQVTMNSHKIAMTSGDTLIIPPATVHAITNMGTDPAEWLLVAPAGVRFFHASGEEADPPWAR